jgi:hypothetical protein
MYGGHEYIETTEELLDASFFCAVRVVSMENMRLLFPEFRFKNVIGFEFNHQILCSDSWATKIKISLLKTVAPSVLHCSQNYNNCSQI